MRRVPAILLGVLGLAVPSGLVLGQAEGPAVKVSTTLHADGTRTVSTVDREAGTAEEALYDAAGKIQRRTAYELNAEGQPVAGVVYAADGKVVSRLTRKYLVDGKLASQEELTADGRLTRRLMFSYDSHGRVSKVEAFDGDGNPLPTGGGGQAGKGKRSGKRR